MGLDDIWGEICRFFIDVSEYIDAGQNVSKYEKAAEKLEKKIKSCQEKIDSLNDSKSGQLGQYEMNGTSAGGELKTVYDQKVLLWDKKYNQTMKKTNAMLNSARGKAKKAREKAAYWKDRQKMISEGGCGENRKTKDGKKRRRDRKKKAGDSRKGEESWELCLNAMDLL